MEEQRVQAHLNTGRTPPPSPPNSPKNSPPVRGWKRGLRSMKSGCLGHPWMALAAVVSLAAPVAVAVLPFHVSKTADGPALDALPMPAAILVHEHDASPISTSISSGDQSEPNRLDATTPRALEPGWDSAPPYPGGPAARQADFQEDTDAGSGVQAVGSNRPATARSRGAWLTGNIEEDPREGHGRRPRGVRP